MRFIHRARRAKYVVVPVRHQTIDGVVTPLPGLRARFFGHVFDSERAQQDLGWTDEERKRVEKHLLTHRDFERHGGYYLDEVVEGRGNSESAKQAAALRAEIGLPATAADLRCTAFFRNEDGEAEQCPRQATLGDYCDEHAPAELRVGTEEEAVNA